MKKAKLCLKILMITILLLLFMPPRSQIQEMDLAGIWGFQIDVMERVHWFINDPVCSISRPVKELKCFDKPLIPKEETIIFPFDIDVKKDFGFVNAKEEKIREEGYFNVIVKQKKIK